MRSDNRASTPEHKFRDNCSVISWLFRFFRLHMWTVRTRQYILSSRCYYGFRLTFIPCLRRTTAGILTEQLSDGADQVPVQMNVKSPSTVTGGTLYSSSIQNSFWNYKSFELFGRTPTAGRRFHHKPVMYCDNTREHNHNFTHPAGFEPAVSVWLAQDRTLESDNYEGCSEIHVDISVIDDF
jgi:hypothetical protein